MTAKHFHDCEVCDMPVIYVDSGGNTNECNCDDPHAKRRHEKCRQRAEKFSSRSDLKRGEKEKVGSIMRGGICESSTVNCEKSFRYPRPPQVKPQFQYKVSSTPIRN